MLRTERVIWQSKIRGKERWRQELKAFVRRETWCEVIAVGLIVLAVVLHLFGKAMLY